VLSFVASVHILHEDIDALLNGVSQCVYDFTEVQPLVSTALHTQPQVLPMDLPDAFLPEIYMSQEQRLALVNSFLSSFTSDPKSTKPTIKIKEEGSSTIKTEFLVGVFAGLQEFEKLWREVNSEMGSIRMLQDTVTRELQETKALFDKTAVSVEGTYPTVSSY